MLRQSFEPFMCPDHRNDEHVFVNDRKMRFLFTESEFSQLAPVTSCEMNMADTKIREMKPLLIIPQFS